ncbi:uncharacterized protein LOC126996358 [Eriocheir sinensis]|uniref:uncharacterized protein LOC126996358 n=1 Tax=Eriocheir sinensis TaxID=95602 RepID=UPI0021CABCDC|nr:uncharacterized protein LOC126996358 [Eriocheir sinensis]
MSAAKIKNKKAHLRQKLGGDGGSGRFLFHKSPASGTTVLDAKSEKSKKSQLQNDLISDLPKDGKWASRQQNLDIISNCPPGQMDDFDGVDRIIEVRGETPTST